MTQPPDAAQLAIRAHSEAVRNLNYLRNWTGYPVDPRLPAPAQLAVMGHLRDRIASGQVTPCPHFTDPRPAYWLARAPGRIRCTECLRVAARRKVKGPRPCDACRHPRPGRLREHAAILALDTDDPGELQVPITVLAGLCRGCAELVG